MYLWKQPNLNIVEEYLLYSFSYKSIDKVSKWETCIFKQSFKSAFASSVLYIYSNKKIIIKIISFMICTGNDVISFYLILFIYQVFKVKHKFCIKILLILLMQNYDINLLLNLLQFVLICNNRVISY